MFLGGRLVPLFLTLLLLRLRRGSCSVLGLLLRVIALPFRPAFCSSLLLLRLLRLLLGSLIKLRFEVEPVNYLFLRGGSLFGLGQRTRICALSKFGRLIVGLSLRASCRLRPVGVLPLLLLDLRRGRALERQPFALLMGWLLYTCPVLH